jgi:hypothetical protein
MRYSVSSILLCRKVTGDSCNKADASKDRSVPEGGSAW